MGGPTNLNLWRANGLYELGEIARESGLSAALAQPLTSLTTLLPSATARILEQLPSKPQSIAALLDDRVVHRLLKEVLGPTGRRDVLRAAREAIEAFSAATPSPGNAPAGQPEDLIDWAFASGLEHALDEPVEALRHLGDDVAVDLSTRTFGHLALVGGVLSSLSRYEYSDRTLSWQRAFMALVRKHLERRAAEVAEGVEQERVAPPAPLPSTMPAQLRALDEALFRWRAKVRATAKPRPLRVFLDEPISLQVEPPAVIWAERVTGRHGPLRPHATVVLQLEDLDRPEADLRCSTCRGSGCAHALTAIDRLRVQLRASSPETLSTLDGLVSHKKWERSLNALTRARNAPAPATDSRVVWRLQGEDFDLELDPLVQKNGKRGFSKGSVLSPDLIANDRGQQFLPADRRAAGTAVVARHNYGLHRSNRAALTLEVLEGHPLLFHDDARSTPLRVAPGRLTLQCQTGPDGGYTLAPAVEGRSFAPDTFASLNPGRAACLDLSKRTCWLVEITPSFLDAVASLRSLGNTFPPEAGDAIAEALAPQGFAVELPPRLLGEEVPARLDAAVYLAPFEALSTQVEVRIKPLPLALPLPAGAGPEVVRGKVGDVRVFARRDFQKERTVALEIFARLGVPLPADASGPATVEGTAIFDLLKALEVEKLETHLPPVRPRLMRPMRAADLRLSVKDGGFWFGLEGEAHIDDQRITLALVLEAARRRQRYVRLSEDRFAEISTELSRQLEPIAEAAFPSKNGDELGLAGVASLEALAVEAHSFQTAESFAAMARRLKSAQSSRAEVPDGLTAALRPYQADGFRWLAGLAEWASGACLADDMGLGKTLQALALLLHRRQLGPAMVIAPTSVCFNWEREAARFAAGLRFHSYRDSDRGEALAQLGPGDVLVVSYGLLARDIEKLKALELATLVVDEAQALKNPEALRTKAARALNAKFRLALTGTPLENHLGELWSLFGVIFPGLLGSLEQFRERFVLGGEGAAIGARRLSRVLKPFLLRRSKGEVASELPPRTEVTVEVALTSEERKLYEQARIAAVAELAGESIDPTRPEQKRFKVLAALTRLRLLACHPRLHDATWAGPASKLARLIELITELNEEGHRALVFSQFTKHLAMVREALDHARIAYVYLDGSTPERERRVRVDEFQQGSAPVFLISLKAGGTGLNLTAADNVIHLDPWWNPAVEDQATDRAHRIGQVRPVTVYRLVTTGTIEEKILALHAEKRNLVAQVLDGTDVAARLSTEDMLQLLEKSARVDEAEAEREQSPAKVDPAALVEDFRAWLEAKDIGDAPRKTYPRSVTRFLSWRQGGGSLDLATEGPRYLEAIATGQFAAPKSEPMLARPALKMLKQFLELAES